MIKVSEFINGWKAATDKTEYAKKHVMATYIPYETKLAQIENIINAALYKEVNGRKIFWMNTPLHYNFYVQSILKLYTDIDITDGGDPEESLRGFNMIEEAGAMPSIAVAIGPDVDNFKTLLQMATDDALTNNSLTNWLDGKTDAFEMAIRVMADAIRENPEILKTE